MIIGVTGNSGTGKTEIARLLADKMDAIIIDADKIVKQMSKPGYEYYEKIVNLFGTEVVMDNNLNRKKIAETIYKDAIKRESLNELTYKYVVEKIQNEIERNKDKNIILDAPLLFESGLDKCCKFTIAVIADNNKKIERICKRDKIEKKLAQDRLNIQQNDEYYTKKANYVIINNGDLQEIDLEDICTKIGKN